MSQQSKSDIICFLPSYELKIVACSSAPLWNSLHLLFCGFQFYTWGPRVHSDVVKEGERCREGVGECLMHMCVI